MQTKNAQCLNMQNAKTGRVETRLTWSAGNPGSFSPPLSANPCLFWMPKMTYELMDRASAFSPMLSKERLLSPFSVSVSSLSSGFLHLLLPCSADFICRKWSKDRKAVLASFLFLFFFFRFFSLLLSTFPTSQQHWQRKETSSLLCVFFLAYCLPLFSIFLPPFLFSFSSFLFSPPLR